MRVVTISATYGAGGSVIGPAVAERLAVPFVDRAIPATVAAEIGVSLEEVLAHDDRAEHGLGRLLAGASRLPGATVGGMEAYMPRQRLIAEEEFVSHTEAAIRDIVGRGGGVVLGRAAALVLADYAEILHVRLDGPAERRLAQAMRLRGIDRETAAAQQRDTDRARTAYVKHFYRTDPASTALYHITLDSTAVPLDLCVDTIVRVATAMQQHYAATNASASQAS